MHHLISFIDVDQYSATAHDVFFRIASWPFRHLIVAYKIFCLSKSEQRPVIEMRTKVSFSWHEERVSSLELGKKDSSET